MHELVRAHHRNPPRLQQLQLGVRLRYPHGRRGPEVGVRVRVRVAERRRRPGLQHPGNDGGGRRHVPRGVEVELPDQLLHRRLRGGRGQRRPRRAPSALLLLARHLLLLDPEGEAADQKRPHRGETATPNPPRRDPPDQAGAAEARKGWRAGAGRRRDCRARAPAAAANGGFREEGGLEEDF